MGQSLKHMLVHSLTDFVVENETRGALEIAAYPSQQSPVLLAVHVKGYRVRTFAPSDLINRKHECGAWRNSKCSRERGQILVILLPLESARSQLFNDAKSSRIDLVHGNVLIMFM